MRQKMSQMHHSSPQSSAARAVRWWYVDAREGDRMSNDTKRWQDMTPDEQTVLIRSGTVNGLQFARPGPRRGGEGLAGEAEKALIARVLATDQGLVARAI